jgi:hypothetical protein
MNEILQALGRMEGKLDQVIEAAKEHREDDKRRFSDVYTKLGEQAEEINKAKGAKGVIIFLVGGGAAAIASFVSWIVGRP